MSSVNKSPTMNYRHPYSDKERKAIVDFIVNNERYSEVKGVKLWMDMEREKVVKRTWQSIKEHFRKKIVYNLRHFDLTPAQKTMLLHGARGISPLKRMKSGKYVGKSSPEKAFNIDEFSSSDEESKPVNNVKPKRKLEVEFSDSDSEPKNNKEVKYLHRKSKQKSATVSTVSVVSAVPAVPAVPVVSAASVSVSIIPTDSDETDYEPENLPPTPSKSSTSIDFLNPSHSKVQTKQQIFDGILNGLETRDSCKIRNNVYGFIVKSMLRIIQGKDHPLREKKNKRIETLSALAFKKLTESYAIEIGNICSESIVQELSNMMETQK